MATAATSNGLLLATEHLAKEYRGRRVVNGVSVTVGAGEIVGLLGPNGAGKTTTFNMVVGVVKPDEGHVSFRNRDITGLPMHKRARLGIGYLTQEPSVFRKLTVEENILAILETCKLSRSERAVRPCLPITWPTSSPCTCSSSMPPSPADTISQSTASGWSTRPLAMCTTRSRSFSSVPSGSRFSRETRAAGGGVAGRSERMITAACASNAAMSRVISA